MVMESTVMCIYIAPLPLPNVMTPGYHHAGQYRSEVTSPQLNQLALKGILGLADRQ